MSTATEKHAESEPPTSSGTRRAVGFGKYRLFARLGSGGMADVYLALAQGAMNVNRLVVIKRLREEEADGGVREMFLDEARLAARLNHPNVIQTFEAGDEDGSLFLAMEYVDGQPLSRVLTTLKRSGRTLEPRMAARICADALEGLHYAHELTDFDGSALEIVHRDVSPQNIMLTYEGAVKLVDFGIAKAVGTAQTAHGVFKGKVAFMAPEQVRCEHVDRRADLFAAGIVLWESVTGKRLMSESTPAATLYNLMTKAIPLASEANSNVPPALDAIIQRALRRDVSERFQTAKEMRDALEAFVTSTGGVTREEVGELTKTLFADTRNKVRDQIKSQLAALSFGRAGESGRHIAHDLSRTKIRQLTSVLIDLDEASETSSNASVFRVVTSRGKTSRAQRVALIGWFVVPLVALAASGIALLRSPSPGAPPVAAVTATVEPAPPVAAVVSPAPPVTATPAPTPTAVLHATAQPARPTPVYVPYRPTPVVSTAPVQTTAPEPPRSSAVPPLTARSQEPPQGRTFRRDL